MKKEIDLNQILDLNSAPCAVQSDWLDIYIGAYSIRLHPQNESSIIIVRNCRSHIVLSF